MGSRREQDLALSWRLRVGGVAYLLAQWTHGFRLSGWADLLLVSGILLISLQVSVSCRFFWSLEEGKAAALVFALC